MICIRRQRLACLLRRGLTGLVLFGATLAHAFELAFTDGATGISCRYFDVQLTLEWPDGPSWTDADGQIRGARPWARHEIAAGDPRRVHRIDVSSLVRSWTGGRQAAVGFLLRESTGHLVEFHAREADSPALRPQLLVRFRDGRRRFLEPAADATLDCSTYKGQGALPTLRLVNGSSIALRFELPRDEGADIQSAELVLVRTEAAPTAAPVSLSVQALRRPYGDSPGMPVRGLASQFPGDREIDSHPDVVFHDAMEGSALDRRWRHGEPTPAGIVGADAANGFVPLSGRALRVVVPKGRQLGLDLRFRFRDHLDTEPEQIYFRYYLRLAADWRAAVDGGKLPGLAGTYGRAGWGGRAWDGAAGWSLRGGSSTVIPVGHAAQGHVLLSTYAYHAGAQGRYGESLLWADADLAGLVTTERWVCIEQHVRLNTPGRSDGVLQVWVDGRLALRRTDLRLRDSPDIRIEEVWMNVYHGGTSPAPANLHAFIDQVVVARSYIGPMAE